MASLIARLYSIINSLLPFTRPGTPILQDIVHTAVICAFLYFLPQFAEWQQRRKQANTSHGTDAQYEEELEHEDPQDLAQGVEDAAGEAGTTPWAQPLNDGIDPQAEALRPAEGDPADPIDAAPAEGPDVPQQPQAQPRRVRDQANVGAKKAKSLARREQRRAYHEFVRNQAEQQRAVDASTAEVREAAVSAEKERRAEAEKRLDEQREKQRRSAKAEREERERVEAERRVTCEKIIKARLKEEGAIDLMEVTEEIFIDDVFAMKLSDADADQVWQEKLVWVERLVRAIPGLLGKRMVDSELVVTMMTASRWIVSVDREVLDAAYKRAEFLTRDRLRAGGEGRIEMKEFGHVLEDVLMVSAAG